MADEASLHRRVTEYMLDSCRYAPNDSEYVDMLTYSARAAGLINELFSSGSTAELYIKPALSCIGDVDIMMTSSYFLAIPHGRTPPTILPSHFEPEVHVVDIIDGNQSDQHGYVYLRLSHILLKSDSGFYVAEKIENRTNDALFFPRHVKMFQQGIYIPELLQRCQNEEVKNFFCVLPSMTDFHGPAMRNSKISEYFHTSSLDFVPCVHCFAWPPQAAGWPSRSRDYDWPDVETINMVVSSGCDLVGAVYASCKHDEWMSDYQCRLSFSRAEIILLRSWTPVQQIIYHMLRFVMKRTVLSETDDDDDHDSTKLSNFHIKTLMLWECEQKPQSWWSAESSLIKICSALLHKLSDWVAVKHCQHYFISNCNLLRHFMQDNDGSVIVSMRLQSLADESFLLSWFIENYICQCIQSCPAGVSALFEDIRSSEKVEKAIDAAIDFRLSELPQVFYNELNLSEVLMLAFIHLCRDATGIQMLLRGVQNFNRNRQDYCLAITSLWVANKISLHSLTGDLLDILWTLFGSCIASVDDTDGEVKSWGCLSIRKAIELVSSRGVSSNASEMSKEMSNNEMSKAYLHRSLRHGQESTRCVVHVLLAALYYNSGHRQAAIDHCKQVLNVETGCEQLKYHGVSRIGARCLPQIDKNIDAVFGLIAFYEHVQRNVINFDEQPLLTHQQTMTVTPLAHYLYLQCSAAATRKQFTRYRRHLATTDRPLLSDMLLYNVVQTQFAKIPNTSLAETASNDAFSSMLVTTLELVALEKLIVYRQRMVEELHSKQFPAINEFEALYAYKCGRFEECLEMCRNRVEGLLPVGCSQLYLLECPELLCLLDGELVSFYGLLRLLCPMSSVLTAHPEYRAISTANLSLYLMAECQKKLRRKESQLRETLRLILSFYQNVVCEADNDVCLEHLVLRMTYRSLIGLLYAESIS